MKPTPTKLRSTLRATITYLNSNGVTNHVDVPANNQKNYHDYNCWGFTRGILNTDEEFEWFEKREMEDWLQDNTVEINMHKEPLKCGDIVVFRGVDEDECCCNMYDEEGEDFEVCTCELLLTHTDILVDPIQLIVIHKPGRCPLERCTLAYVAEEHSCYGEVTEYRRIKK